MEKSPHVLMAREGAEAFVKEHGVELVSPRYFVTPFRKQELERIKDAAKAKKQSAAEPDPQHLIGTVGAVALDSSGNLAAGTSTGGMVNKRFGRIGDSPIIGAGTYAKNATCAVSCTGHGEFFIRSAVAHDVSALMEYKRLPLREAAEEALRRVGELGGKGGFIAIDRNGNIAIPFNTEGMFRGVIREDGDVTIDVYRWRIGFRRCYAFPNRLSTLIQRLQVLTVRVNAPVFSASRFTHDPKCCQVFQGCRYCWHTQL
jgi:beta-aspartyl-peptidase (threonine type)